MLPGRKYTVDDVLRMAWQRRWFIVLPLLVIGAATVAYERSLPDRFRAETTILIVPQRVPESYVRATVTSRIEDRLQSLRQQILSRGYLEPIVVEFNLYPEERKTQLMETVVDQMRRDITVEIVRGDAFSVAYVSTDPRAAMRVAERLASLFINENLHEREVLADGTNDFLETQLVEARGRLEEHEQKLAAYRREYSGELPSQLESNLQILNNLNMQVQALVNDIERDRDRSLVLERSLTEVPAPPALTVAASTPEKAAPLTTRQRLDAARASLAELRTRLTPEHPDVIAATRLVGELERALAAETGTGPVSPAPTPAPTGLAREARINDLRLEKDNLDRGIARKQAEEARLRSSIATYQARVEATPSRESELTALTRDYETLEKAYTSLLAKKEDSALAANLERRQVGEQFKVLDQARIPQRPVSPNRRQIDLLGIIAGLAFGMALAGVLEYRDSSLRTEDDIRTCLALPVLAAIPLLTASRLAPSPAATTGRSALSRLLPLRMARGIHRES